MKQEPISQRQVIMILLVALLSPAVRQLPVRTAQEAGRAGWLSALAALPLVLILCTILSELYQRVQRYGLSGLLLCALGRPLGYAVTAAYFLWGLLLLSANTRLFGLRFLSTGYRNSPLEFFMVAALLVVLWMSTRERKVFARASQIFGQALSICLGLCIVFGVFRVRPLHILPVWTENIPGIVRSVKPVLGVFGYMVFAGSLAGKEEEGSSKQTFMKWVTLFSLMLTALQMVCIGCFGAGLTTRMDTPFFAVTKGIGVTGAFERVESVVVSLWVLSDLVLMTLLTNACSTAVQQMLKLRTRTAAVIPVTVLAYLGARLLFRNAFSLREWFEHWGEWGNIIMGCVIPAAVLMIVLYRESKEKSISCG